MSAHLHFTEPAGDTPDTFPVVRVVVAVAAIAAVLLCVDLAVYAATDDDPLGLLLLGAVALLVLVAIGVLARHRRGRGRSAMELDGTPGASR